MNARRLARAVVFLATLASCAGPVGPPAIARGRACAHCGMEVQDLRFACERPVGERWRVFDSIECLLADPIGEDAGIAWLSDYDTQALGRADSLWVVRGRFASPMGGGFAAFRDRAAALRVADDTGGRVERLEAWRGAVAGSRP